MRRPITSRVLLASLVALAAACSDASQQSQPSPNVPRLSSGTIPLLSQTLARRQALRTDVVRTIVVGSNGGRIEIPEDGLRVDIPSNALPKGRGSVSVKVTALAGSQLAYEFEPTGTTFTQPLRFEQDLNSLTLTSSLLGRLLPSVSYFKSRSDLNASNGVARTYEELLTAFDLSGHTLKAEIWHFSGYVVSWGREAR